MEKLVSFTILFISHSHVLVTSFLFIYFFARKKGKFAISEKKGGKRNVRSVDGLV